MKKIFVLILILSLALSLFSACGSSQDVKPEKVDSETSQQKETKTETETYEIGDSVKAGNLIFTVNSTRTDAGGDFIKPKDGYIYYIIDVTVENTGDKSESVSSLMMFKLFDSQGYNYTITIGPETQGSVNGEISAGRKLRGELAFEIPKDATGLELQIDPTLFGSGQIIVELDR
ncbi:MAG TPA: DUF4352 domain-containing protein [Bacillota bacterium]|nr:DUF4352 domain-containing protein [Bacillota bacterium]HOK68919.1 DUF4352 domain-containing protein [Bacillota bacterium]HPP85295.1 DUF4352 domain-containing protein [Bacillota bacterium]